eukprot:1013698-Rhodomonas_salina.1
MAAHMIPQVKAIGKRDRDKATSMEEEVTALVRTKKRRIARNRGEDVTALDTRAVAIASTLGGAREVRRKIMCNEEVGVIHDVK